MMTIKIYGVAMGMEIASCSGVELIIGVEK
jgi:hypothetical protein